jgi:hypothetical protein
MLSTWGAAQEVTPDPVPVPTAPPSTSNVAPADPLAMSAAPADPLTMKGDEGGETYATESNPFQVEYEAPKGIANVIVGDGITVKQLVYYGDGVQRGLFHNGYAAIGFDNGAIFSTGDIKQAMDGVDDSDLQEPGYYPLSKLIPVGETHDASVLRVVFKCPSSKRRASVRYVFGSNEYPTSAGGTDPEDVMAIFLNGKGAAQNIAVVDGTYVSTRTLRSGPNFINNLERHRHVQIDGFTIPLTTKVRMGKTGWNELRIAIADGGNNNFKGTSFLFIPEDGLMCT